MMSIMYDDSIAAARSMIFTRYAQFYTSFNSELVELKGAIVRKQLFSSGVATRFQDICSRHLKAAAKFVFGVYEKNFAGPGISSPTLNTCLKDEFSTEFGKFYDFVSVVLEHQTREKETGKYFCAVNFEHLHSKIMLEYHARIDLLCRKLAQEADQTRIKDEIEVTGDDNSIPAGDHNTQHVQTTIQVFEMAIDKIDSTPGQKAEAKSLLKSALNNPILASILGYVAGQVDKD